MSHNSAITSRVVSAVIRTHCSTNASGTRARVLVLVCVSHHFNQLTFTMVDIPHSVWSSHDPC